jgi:hypothetical protein
MLQAFSVLPPPVQMQTIIKKIPMSLKSGPSFVKKEIQEQEEEKANNTAVAKSQRAITSNALALQAQEKKLHHLEGAVRLPANAARGCNPMFVYPDLFPAKRKMKWHQNNPPLCKKRTSNQTPSNNVR